MYTQSKNCPYASFLICFSKHAYAHTDTVEEEQSQAPEVPALPPLPPEHLDTAIQVYTWSVHYNCCLQSKWLIYNMSSVDVLEMPQMVKLCKTTLRF